MPTELIIVLVVGLLLLFSAKKLPDMARGLGQSMRVFKAETRGLRDDEQSARSPAQTSNSPADDPSTGANPAGAGSGAGQSRHLEPGEPGGVTRPPLTVDPQASHGAASRGAGPAAGPRGA